MRIATCLLTLCLVSSAHAQQTNADDDVARNLFQAGARAYEAGNYEDALRYFEDAHTRSHRPQLLYNIGQAADRLRNDDKALAAFRAYLTALPDAENRQEVENRIRALERRRQAPSPRETAEAAATTQDTSAATMTTASESDAVTTKWWLWAAIGGAVVIGVVAAVALSSGDTRQGPIESTTGVTVMTLGGGR